MKPFLFVCMLFLLISCTPAPATAVPIPATRTPYSPTEATVVPSLTPTATVTIMPMPTAAPTRTATPVSTATFTPLPPPSPMPILSAACQPPEDPSDWPSDAFWSSCIEQETSPDGQWIATFWGFGYCGKPLAIFNVVTSELRPVQDVTSATWFEFLPDNRLLFGQGCGDEHVFLYDPVTDETRWLATGSPHTHPQWNDAHTGFMMHVLGWSWHYAYTWAYHVATNQVFFSTEDTLNRAHWTPDGSALIYQHVSKDYVGDELTLGPGSIHLVDMEGAAERPLLSDPQYHYYLCLSGKCQWNGDWLLIQRIPFTPHSFAYEGSEEYDSRAETMARNCALFAGGCQVSVENSG